MSSLTLTAPPGPAVAATEAAPRPRAPIRDVLTMIDRSVRLSRRNIEAMMTSLMLPVMLMLVFVYLFGGALNTGGPYVNYVVPGLILLCAGFGSATTAVAVSQDLRGGIIDRFRSMDVSATAVVAGQVVASVVRNLVSTVVVFGVALAIGFRPHATPLGWLGVLGILLLFMTAISWLSAAAGVLASSPEAANGVTFVVMFLPYASSAFVPIATMPAWLRGFSRNQPCTPIIESLRSLLAGHSASADTGSAISWCVGILAVAVVASGAAYRSRRR